MHLTAGTRLGPYEILSAIGAGGMGEVYRARDTRLDRTVAIKVLPEHLSNDPERRQRFEREARAVSSLNHPHICTLHDIGQHGAIDFIVMEYVKGQTLAERLATGPLPVSDVLRYATEVADALDKAHRQGVIHRDLKPSNIMLTQSGAKLLDFGLAKIGATAPGAAVNALPTHDASLTGPGTILGTFQYMAPEQLEGGETDARTDIFTFGTVVYEMATGKKAFYGKSHASLVGAILKDEPPSITASQRLAPRALDRVVKLCLAKDPEQRWQTAHDLLLALGGIAERDEKQAIAPPVRKTWQSLLWAVSVLLALAFAATAGYLLRPTEDALPMRFEIDPPEGFLLSGLDASGAVAVSPDGRRIAFTATRGQTLICVRSVDSVDAQPLAGTAGAALPFWSADSRFLGFFVDGKLRKIEASGGTALTLCDVPAPRGGTWNRDGTIVFGRDNSGLHKVSAAGGVPTPVTKLDETRREIGHRWPRFLPDGRHFLYQATGSPDGPAVYVADLEGKERNLLLNAATNAEYALGHLVYLRQSTLVAQRFDPKGRVVEGEAFAVAEQISLSAPQGRGMFSVSDTGLLAYRAGSLSGEAQLAWVDRNGKQSAVLGEAADYINPEVSPDGKKIAVGKADPRTGDPDIWLYEVARGLGTRFTRDRAQERRSVWSPDGRQIVFNSSRKKVFDIYRKHLSGSGTEELLTESNLDKYPTSWSPDGKFVLYHTWADPQTRGDLWILPVSGDRKPVAFLKTEFSEINGRFSPDGRWVVFSSDETGSEEVYITPFPGPGAKWRVSASGGTQPKWSRAGREVVYIASDGKLVAASVRSGSSSVEIDSVRPLFALNSAPWLVYDVSQDGNRFLVITSRERQDSSPITLVLNSIHKLRR